MKSFQHDTGSLSDKRLRKVIRTHGAIGYGVWWAVLEELYKTREEDGFQIKVDELWLEKLSESLYLPDCKIFLPIFNTFASIELISPQKWSERYLYIQEVAETVKRLYRSSGYRKHRTTVLLRDGVRCVYCGSGQDLTLDHVIPQARGGSHALENLVTACRSCNSSKGDRSIQEWKVGS